MQAEKIEACNNTKCVKKEACLRYKLFQDGAEKCETNGGNAQKGCKKFIQKSA
jgi:hypothetical protein